MRAIFRFLRYAADNRGLILLNFGFNLLYILLQLITLLLIMPVLRFLFEKDESALKIKEGGIQVGAFFTDIYYSFINWFSAVAKGDPSKALMYLCLGLIIITIFKNIFRYLAMNFMVLIRNYSIRKMRLNIYNKALDLPISYFNEERKGDLLSRMSNDMKEIEFALMVSLEALYFQPLNIIIFMTALVVLSPSLTLYILIFLPVTALIIGLVGRSLRKKSQKNQYLAGRILTAFEESISGIRIIKAFNAIPYFRNKYSREDNEYMRNNISVQRRYDLSSPLSETIGICISALLLWLGGNMVFKGELDAEFFLVYFAIFSQLIPPFKAFSNAIYAAEKGMASLDRINELVQAPVKVSDPVNPKKPVFNSEIRMENLGFAYNEQLVISDLSLTIKKGEIVALVGPSGAGKTTLTDLVLRFYDTQQGGISIDGVDIREFLQDDLRRLMGVVAQESILFNDSIRNNIALGLPDATDEDIIAAAKAANAHEFIVASDNGYDTNVGERGSKLSGGQRQRISIARALLKNPEILILDEATSALDSQSEKAVQKALETLMENRTSIIIAHRLSTVTHADKIVVMDKGSILEVGTHQELLASKGLYYSLIQLQQLN